MTEERIVRSNFGKNIDLDLSSSEKEYEQLMFPLNRTFDWDAWQNGLFAYCWGNEEKKTKIKIFQDFKNEILQNFKSYQVPVIASEKTRSERRFASCSRK